MAVLFIFVVLTQGSAWMIVSDRGQAMAGLRGGFPRYFGEFHERFGTPVRVNMLSGVVASVFMVIATNLVGGSAAAVFTVVLTIAITTLLLSYLIIFLTVVRLRRRYPNVERPYRVPGGQWGLWMCASIIYLWVALGSWIAIFPGTIEAVLGVQYDFEKTWGVSRSVFEVFTVGTLALVVLLATAGYVVSKRGPAAADMARELQLVAPPR